MQEAEVLLKPVEVGRAVIWYVPQYVVVVRQQNEEDAQEEACCCWRVW